MVGSEGKKDPKGHLIPSPSDMGRDTFYYTRLLQGLALNTPRDGTSRPSLGNLVLSGLNPE